ncbi:MAG: C25 family cysteine peptidase, partial [Panacibacter sp.]
SADQFQLWRDGAEVPLYVSVPSGPLSGSDYIEFWGEMTNGKADKYLYKDSSYQLTDHTSLETDTASYFLTVNPVGNNKRFNNTANNTAGTSLSPEKNFMYTANRIFRGVVHNGFGVFVEERLYASTYDMGEGLASRNILSTWPLYPSFYNLYVDTLGQPMTMRANMAGAAPNDRYIKILLNSDSITQFQMGYFQLKKLVVTGISPVKIKNNSAIFTVQNLTGNGDDCRMGQMQLDYPRLFNFGAASSFEFYIDSSSQGRYLKISNFNKGTAAAVLYDFTNGKRYTGNPGLGDTLEFLLAPSVNQYHLVLVRNDGSTAKVINTIEQRNFVDYSKPANQGNYLIISNPLLYGTTPDNYIQQYSDYRMSDSGGKYNVKIIDIHELEDQFAYGIKMHPLSIKNFLRFSRANYQQPPSYVFLIGKGVTYNSYRLQETNPLTIKLNLIPVFGSPGSDNLLSSDTYDPVPTTPIGRLSAVTPGEVGVYLAKVKEYEAAQRDTSSANISNNLWKKKVLQLAGANDPLIASIIDSFQVRYTKIISGPSFGGNVRTFSKSTSTGSEYGQSVLEFTNEFNQGSALVEYLGHSSSTSIDFSLDNPANYNNTGKYPLFIVNGCLAGNIFDYDINRLNSRSTISEKFVLEPQKGAIGYLSSTSFGVLNYLDVFTEKFYDAITGTQYGKGFGNIVQDGLQQSLDYTGNTDFYGLMHAEQLTFHGDPSLKMNYYNAPDYAIDSAEMNVAPGYMNVAMDSFTVNFKVRNLGKATTDPVNLSLFRKYPNGVSENIYNDVAVPAVNSVNSYSFKLPIVANRDKGSSVITAVIDSDNTVSELKENNNTGSITIKIATADLLPVSPYNYSIVNTNQVDLIASTAYAFDSLTQYVMEIDTTSLFNSAAKFTKQQVGTGGIIEFTNVPLALDNTVYFWRVAEDSTDKHWNTFSFIHRSAGNAGFEQAHFLQHTQSSFNKILPDSASRSYNFAKNVNNIFILHSIYPTSGNEDNHFSIALNGSIITWSACVGSSIIFNVFDPKTFKPILNTTNPYGAASPCDTMRRYNFEYWTQDAANRKKAMDFMDNYVQNGYFVVVRKIYDLGNADWAPTVWASDTATYGSGNSLYHRLKSQGIQVDSFTFPRTFMGIYKKNDSATYKPVTVYSTGIYDRISLSQNYYADDTVGTITSPKFGPGTSWSKVKWSGYSTGSNTNSSLDVIAIDQNGKDSVFFNIDTTQHELDISTIDASAYPYVQLRMHTTDSITIKPYQLQDWSVEFTAVPEGALATNLGSKIPEELVFDHNAHLQFDTLQGYVIFKNISATAMGPLKTKIILYDESNFDVADFVLPSTRALPAGDTVHIPFLLNVTDLEQGKYNFYIEINPDNDQPEQYHYNNFLYKYIDIKRNVILASHSLDLSVKPVNKTVELKWTVTNELNVSVYDVQFSKDGRSFTTIGKVAPSGSAAAIKQYGFIHSNPINGANYYRIKMTDKDGSVKYSPVRQAEINVGNILVYPNPFKNFLNIILKDGAATVKLRITDVSGKLLLQQTFSGATTLNINNMAAGMYILQVIDGSTVHSFKIYKQ